MQHGQRHRISFLHTVHHHFFPSDGGIGYAVVPEGCENGDAAAIKQVAIMRKDVAGCGHGPDFGASEQTERFGREGGRTAESDFKEAGKEGLGLCLSRGELSGGGMRRGMEGRDSKWCRLCIEYRLWDDSPSDFERGRRHWG